ncbi:MAG: GIY-YIG nuclease family protein [Cyanomargarita calcarea GSE-NOS-MK-12-04C]|jgi:hypothetical protein|uniref:GIY-YIG nuclease family protein n=1 Tax=Cyanomargarita calcarea GSE-NOS-MK-12-04C TaxID=2839659 RepID=A0A951QZE3_9CYAN|nr:GIY-YIG nuclease family protein [Cyanomargarita calcarea GSE-NOS-MK-12-04C]
MSLSRCCLLSIHSLYRESFFTTYPTFQTSSKDISKRIKSLQTSSPAKLKLIKSIQVESDKEAQELEQSLHKQFQEIRLAGEWFKAEANLFDYINQV